MWSLDKDHRFVLMEKQSAKISFFSVDQLNSFDFIPYSQNLIFYTTKKQKIFNNVDTLNQKIIKKEYKLNKNLKKLSKILALPDSLISDTSIYDFIEDHSSENLIAYKGCQFDQQKHYLHFRGLVDLPPSFNADSITLIGGPCLFSVKDVFLQAYNDHYYYPLSIKERLATDDQIRVLHLRNRLSFYEYESIIRQTNVVSSIINTMNNQCLINLRIDIPTIHYYFYFFDYFFNKKMSHFLLLRWFEVIEQRSSLVFSLYRASVLKEVKDKKINIIKTDSFKAIRTYLINCITDNKMPEFHNVLSILSERGDQLWRKILNLKKPNNYLQLTWLAYALEEIKAAQSQNNSNHLAIIIENFPEWKILYEAKKMIKKMNDFKSYSPMIGIYPLEKLIVKNESARSFALYANEWPNIFLTEDEKPFSYETLLQMIY